MSPSDIHHPAYSIRKHLAFWSLTFNGLEACFDHEQGAYYVAWLLLNPPPEPIHALALEIKSLAYFGGFSDGPGETEILLPRTGRIITVDSDAILEQRNFSLDDNEGQWFLRRKQRVLEAILEDETATEPVRAEVLCELEELYEYQKRKSGRTSTTASKAVRAVREAIRHLHRNFAAAVDSKGKPHPVLRPFARHLQEYVITPTVRYTRAGTGRIKAGVAGCFTYEPPSGVKWTV